MKVVLFMRGPLNAKCYLLYLSEGEWSMPCMESHLTKAWLSSLKSKQIWALLRLDRFAHQLMFLQFHDIVIKDTFHRLEFCSNSEGGMYSILGLLQALTSHKKKIRFLTPNRSVIIISSSMLKSIFSKEDNFFCSSSPLGVIKYFRKIFHKKLLFY